MRPDGFTLVELVMTMVVLGILAAVAIPRFFERQTYDARAFLDRTAALLRYAQKAAIAQRRTVCADFTASSATLKIRATEGDGPCDTNLAGPTGERPYVLTAPAGVSFSSFASLSFKADGSPSAGATYSVAGFPPLTVEAVTGYVH